MSEVPQDKTVDPEDSGTGPEENPPEHMGQESWAPDPSPLLSPLAVFDNPSTGMEEAHTKIEPAATNPALFQSWSGPEVLPQPRIPHLGHLALLMVFATIGFACAIMVGGVAFYFHLFGVTKIEKTATEIHYTLGFEAILYLVTLALSILLFPALWGEDFLAGVQWQGRRALRLRWKLAWAVLGCFVIAVLDMFVLPAKSPAPITEMFTTASAAWLMFGFGITFAPFFEELAFRGFLLPALCTAWDWSIERSTDKAALPLDEDGHPRWSFFAMAVGSVLTSVPFALIHVEQQGHSLGPFVLIIVVSLVLCAVRLKTRSLAACTLVHAGYNFLLFFFMMVGTDGFKHMDKM